MWDLYLCRISDSSIFATTKGYFISVDRRKSVFGARPLLPWLGHCLYWKASTKYADSWGRRISITFSDYITKRYWYTSDLLKTECFSIGSPNTTSSLVSCMKLLLCCLRMGLHKWLEVWRTCSVGKIWKSWVSSPWRSKGSGEDLIKVVLIIVVFKGRHKEKDHSLSP